VLDPHGMPGDPCTEAERKAKFSRLAASVLPAPTVKRIVETVARIETLPSVRDLGGLLRA
jgi:hypothetical protein